MAKTMITAVEIEKLHKEGKQSLNCDSSMIITPLARDKAKELKIKICDGQAVAMTQASVSHGASDNSLRAQVKAELLKKLPDLKDAALLDRLIDKAMSEQKHAPATPAAPTTVAKPDNVSTASAVACDNDGRQYLSGLIAVDHTKINIGKFEDAPCEEEIRIVDVITSKDGAPMGVGYLEWNNASFPWHLDYDEIDIIIEGELHIIVGDKKIVGKKGDALYIPKGSDIIFSAPSYVKFAYITYPADWS